MYMHNQNGRLNQGFDFADHNKLETNQMAAQEETLMCFVPTTVWSKSVITSFITA